MRPPPAPARHRPAWSGVLLALVAAVGPACAGPGPAAEPAPLPSATALITTTTAVPATTTTTLPAGCGSAFTGDIDVDGRPVSVRRPERRAPGPLVVVLHGYTGSPALIERTSGWTAWAARTGAVVAYPRGGPTTDGGHGWNTGTVRFSTAGVDDAGILADVVAALVATQCGDGSRVVLTGESNGGAMVVRAACDPRLEGRLALAAPVIPAIDGHVLTACADGRPVPLVAVASMRDEAVDYRGVYPAGVAPLLGQEAWFARFAADRNRCRAGVLVRQPVDHAEQVSGQGCAARTTLYAVTDGVHTWPGGPVGSGDLDPGRFPATAVIAAAAGLAP